MGGGTFGGEPMIEEVTANIYRIIVPLPIPLLDSINSYVVTGPDRNLIIDTGMAHNQCMDVMQAGLEKLGVDLHRTDFFVTHHHGDHFGLVCRLVTDESVIYINGSEAALIERIRSKAILADVAHFLAITGFPERDPQEIIPPRAGDEYWARDFWPFRFVGDGDILDTGGYRFRCIRTPGHSSGHTCLYEPDKHILLSGDHLLHDITPSIQLRSDRENPLEDYMRSLDRMYRMDIELVLPGHRAIFRNCKERIAQLKAHHQDRAAEVLSALADGSMDAYQVASQIPWNIVDCEGWGSVPLLQKFFATGEAFAHLRYLEGKGQIQKQMRGRRIVYSLAETSLGRPPR